jgi:hypothetical protein
MTQLLSFLEVLTMDSMNQVVNFIIEQPKTNIAQTIQIISIFHNIRIIKSELYLTLISKIHIQNH